MKQSTKEKLLKLIHGERQQDVHVDDCWRFQLMPKKYNSDSNTLKVFCHNYHIGDIMKGHSKAESRHDNYKFLCSHTFLKSCEKYGFFAEKEIKRAYLDEVVVILDYMLGAAAKLIRHYEYHDTDRKFQKDTEYKLLKGA